MMEPKETARFRTAARPVPPSITTFGRAAWLLRGLTPDHLGGAHSGAGADRPATLSLTQDGHPGPVRGLGTPAIAALFAALLGIPILATRNRHTQMT